ncbi:outer membrane protein assembly complex, YaeT protein [Hydrogenobacter thermophilus TK-6]|uniref:Outer membrane protein assembly factor BamA n=1 Tax=Hydrogenobacter thermophilus (strain DSM 6534 / IAM 12695 / TK-6) TaxID=608538 RepID=D3DIG8_HYDTT|nr:outer membrane protein assembly factor BamA [Hydrogenobacter thermophilus]ADO45546.1 outer membrane protein assembly complex, YaeT protein [Hydrogenobacter thermophilus TK-6]BAI69620.1 outer membrane protein [Hydrogenobacter thermophilus TK-6]
MSCLFKKVLLSSAIFVSLSFGQVIQKVEIMGAKYVPDEVIKALIKAREGLTYTPDLVREDIRRLYRTGFFDRVEVYEERKDGGVILYYDVVDLPIIYKIEFTGNRKIKSEDLEKKIGIETEVGKIDVEELTKGYTSSPAIEEKVEIQRKLKLGRVLSREEMEYIKRKIVEAYAKEGYPNVKVDYELVPKKGASKIVYHIFEGSPEYVSSIHFKGNKTFRAGKLLDHMETKPPSLLALRLRPPFSEDVLKDDMTRLRDFYVSEGFLDAKVSYKIEKKDAKYSIEIDIDEGKRYKLESLKIEGNTLFSYDELVGAFLKKNKGGYYREEVIDQIISNIKRQYSTIGFLNVSVVKDEKIDSEGKKVSLTLKVNEGEPVYIDRVQVRGNYESRDYVIRREMRVQEGELANEREIERSRTRIFNLGYYEDVSIEPLPSEGRRWDLEVKVRERFTGQFSVGLGYNQVTKVAGFVSVRKGNFLGTGDIAGISVSYGSNYKDNSLSYTKKWFLNKPMDLTGSLYDRRIDYTTYTVSRTGLDFILSRELAEFWRVSGGFSIQRVRYSNISSDASAAIRQEAGTRQSRKLLFGITRDTRDNYLFPTKGALTELSYSVAVPVLGGTERFNKVTLSHQMFMKDTLFDTGLILSLKGVVGMAEPYGGKTVPLDERFFVGGDFTIRGYKYGYAGPLDPNTNDPIGASRELILSAELNYPIYKNILYGAVFYDTGLGANSWKDFKPQNFREGFGVGIRFITPFAPIKLDWAFKTKKVPGDTSRSKLHFVLGVFF